MNLQEKTLYVKLTCYPMNKIFAFLTLIILFPLVNSIQDGEKPRVDTPQPGEEIQGTIIIAGNTDIEGFSGAVIYFGYGDSSTWFPVASSDQPVRNGPITQWDTTVIADGIYQLKISVKLRDGSSVETVVPDLRVNNEQKIGESAPETIIASVTPEITQTVPGTPFLATATKLPGNPAAVEKATLNTIMITSGLGTAAIFILAIIVQVVRSKKH